MRCDEVREVEEAPRLRLSLSGKVRCARDWRGGSRLAVMAARAVVAVGRLLIPHWAGTFLANAHFWIGGKESCDDQSIEAGTTGNREELLPGASSRSVLPKRDDFGLDADEDRYFPIHGAHCVTRTSD